MSLLTIGSRGWLWPGTNFSSMWDSTWLNLNVLEVEVRSEVHTKEHLDEHGVIAKPIFGCAGAGVFRLYPFQGKIKVEWLLINDPLAPPNFESPQSYFPSKEHHPIHYRFEPYIPDCRQSEVRYMAPVTSKNFCSLAKGYKVRTTFIGANGEAILQPQVLEVMNCRDQELIGLAKRLSSAFRVVE